MEKKKILIITESLNVGGVEKSCVAFLKTLPENKYDVNLMLLSCEGFLLKQLPAWVNIIPVPHTYACLVHRLKDWRFYIRHSPLFWIKKALRTWKVKHHSDSDMDFIQGLYQQWKSDLPVLEKEYDVAISYKDGFCNYILPTSTALMGIISAVNIPYDRWMKFMWKCFFLWMIIGAFLIFIAQLIKLGPM